MSKAQEEKFNKYTKKFLQKEFKQFGYSNNNDELTIGSVDKSGVLITRKSADDENTGKIKEILEGFVKKGLIKEYDLVNAGKEYFRLKGLNVEKFYDEYKSVYRKNTKPTELKAPFINCLLYTSDAADD